MLRNVFIATENASNFERICNELRDPTSLIGPSLAQVTGPAGRGKSEAAKRRAVQTNDIYLPPMNQRSPLMLLREIEFELAKEKHGRIETCLDVIGQEMGRERRLIIIDEADLLKFSILEMCRNMNERFACPIVFIGETGLAGKLARERRMASRLRCKMAFDPVTQADISLYFENALGFPLTPSDIALVQRHSKGDWRPILTLAVFIDRAMAASGLTEIPEGLVRQIIDDQES